MPATKNTLPETLDSLFGLPYTALKRIEKGTFLFQNKQEVTFDRDFYAGMYPVTQELYEKVMGNNPSDFKGKHRPVENISWDIVQVFLKKLNEQTKNHFGDGLTFRLPTEAMWEYCVRNVTWELEKNADIQRNNYSDFSGSHVLDEVGWYKYNSRKQTHPVGLKEPNLRGLYDMSGNIWEWCQDYYTANIGSDYMNGFKEKEVTNGITRVVRGGSWFNDGDFGRLLNRYGDVPDDRNLNRGFRVFRY